ncbi:glycosyltransferase family 2 protein [Asticcacaulis machinosus]|uniref:Glycosyltransferase family 2 protein n=1 Tax=Asticcacaulis machinosus TaxID=2984211 RepID=A0ABT5HJK9_9CAUL|nr:glycosyltransferase family 2 protein [Asticcacaulis machinosus]MDC7676431.1 glycosyltransferase family 2 protein [Asticcacaulis machinosus]
MANYRGGRFLEAALTSGLSQTVRDIEIIVSDDASPDDSVAVIRAVMEKDDRIRLIEAPQNGGPAKARNRALDAARGEWVAIVDSDDYQHPQRLERLLKAADDHNADLVADDLLHFHDDGSQPISFLMLDHGLTQPFELTTELFIRANTARSGLPTLGYLKPLIRRARLGELRYDTGLKVAEDYDLVVRLLAGGAKGYVVPDPTYLYRRHGGSISHRMSETILSDMIDNHHRFAAECGPHPAPVQTALTARLKGMETDLAYERLVAAIKAKRLTEAVGILTKSPALIKNLYRSFCERKSRQVAPAPAVSAAAISASALILSDKAPDADSLTSLKAIASQRGADNVILKTVPEGFLTEPSLTDPARYRELWAITAPLGDRETLMTICDGYASVNAAGYLPCNPVWPCNPVRDEIEERGQS